MKGKKVLFLVVILFSFALILNATDYTKNSWDDNHEIISEMYANAEDEEGLEIAKQALIANNNLYGKKSTQSGLALNYMGLFASALGYYEDAFDYYEKSIDILKEKGSEQDNNVGIISGNLGSAYLDYGDYSKAEEYLKLSVDKLLKGSLTEDNEEDIILSLFDLSNAYFYQEEYNDAIKTMKTLIDYEKKWYGENDGQVALDLRDLGYYYNVAGDYDNAEKYYNQSLSIYLLNPDDNTQDIGVMYNDFGVLYDEQGEYKKAVEFYDKALIYFNKMDEDYRNNIPNTLYNKALAQFSLEQYNASKENMEKAYKLYKDALGAYDEMTMQIKEDLEIVNEMLE